ncbi:hypothetical protein F5Y10DRAFT_234630 [Nemania abortiva]|nr:hypothetical protein F5Y10DRAFT_234630 [Nemania abortiva]
MNPYLHRGLHRSLQGLILSAGPIPSPNMGRGVKMFLGLWLSVSLFLNYFILFTFLLLLLLLDWGFIYWPLSFFPFLSCLLSRSPSRVS